MELTLLSLLSFFALLILFSISFSFLKNGSKGSSSSSSFRNLPPGKLGFPFIGETLEFLSKGRKGQPENFITERMSKFSSQAFKTSLFGEPMIVLPGARGHKFLFSSEDKFVTSWWPNSFSRILQSSERSSVNEELKQMKKYLPKFLGAEALQQYIGSMDSIAQKHFDFNWEEKDHVTVLPLAKRYTFWLACRVFISIDDWENADKIYKPFEVLASGLFSIPIDFPGTTYNGGIKAANKIRKDLRAIIKQRKISLDENKAPLAHDILSHMLLMSNDDGKSMDEMDIADKILGMLIGGHDTASVVITLIIKYLAELPEIYNELLREQMEIANSKAPGELLNWKDIQKMKYSWNVVCEVLRLAPPLQGTFREAITDFTYVGFTIPKGWKLYWNAHSSHRDPKCFPEPEKFDPCRFEGKGPAPYTYVPFGGGPRMCPGKEYARLEVLVFVHNLVKRFKWEKVLPNEKIIINPFPVPENGLPIRLFRNRI